MRIQSIFINNLWKKGNIHWDLDSKVNILVGNNGSGKSTLLKLLQTALKPSPTKEDKYLFGLIDDMILVLKDENNETHYLYIDSFADRTPEILNDTITCNLINTFDINDSLDTLLQEAKIEYLAYESNILNKMRTYLMNEKEVGSFEERKRFFEKQEQFIEKTNILFKETGKSFAKNQTSDNRHFKFNVDGQINELDHTQLSSGEKQVFYLLISALLQDNKSCITLLDEPELSLHIDWQQKLIPFLQELNPNAQYIIVTHSPNVFFPAYGENMKRMTEIVSDKPNILEIPSRKEEIEAELTRIIQENADKSIQLTKINIYLNKTFVFLAEEDADFVLKFLEKSDIEIDEQTFLEILNKHNNSKNLEARFIEFSNKINRNANILSANFLLKTRESFTNQISLLNHFSATIKIDWDINTFSTLLAKTKNKEEVEQVETYRKRFGIEKNEIYENKLRFKQ
jgi:ABC-type lipoprotein export system ATPase subunit